VRPRNDLTSMEFFMRTDETAPNSPKGHDSPLDDYLDEQEADSFLSSDLHSDWAGPSGE
jgi:hypothetical protein